MDDVWGNAWAQPEEDVAHSVPAKQKTDDAPSWSFSTESTGKDEEADVGLPSWATGELNWTEPTGEASLWASVTAVDDPALQTVGWSTNSVLQQKTDLASINVFSEDGNSTPEVSEEVEQPDRIVVHHDMQEEFRSSSPVSTGTITSVDKAGASTPVEESTPPQASPSYDVSVTSDNFGSFEDGLSTASAAGDESRITWASPVAAFDDAGGEEDAWGSAWAAPDLANANDEEQKDEWTMARKEKERRDRSVPPEVLATIIDHLNDLNADLWPEKDLPKLSQDMGNWRDGMNNVDGLEALMRSVVPEVPGQPPIRFANSHVAKAMAKSVKLSKNLPVVRNSPMSHLFTAKSLAAWELAVKSKIEVRKDDIPAGWRPVEPEQKEESRPAVVERKSSGIFSFFSKRVSGTATSVATTASMDSKRSSLSREVSSDTASVTSPARNSSDANSLSSKMKQSPSVSSFASVVPPSLSSPTTASSSKKPVQASSPTPPSSGQTQSSSAESPIAPAPAPSAVSRCFNRFSRTRTDVRPSSSSSRSSIALSTDDLEFLSDIVPSHSDDADENEQLNSLSAFVSSPAAPTKLPPPLAPPPLAPPPRPSSTNLSRISQPNTQSLEASPVLPVDQNLGNALDDLDGLGTLTSTGRQSPQVTTGNGVTAPSLSPALPPPLSPASVAPLSKPPTPSPLSGGVARARRSVSSLSSARAFPRATSATPPKVASPGPSLESLSPLSTGVTSIRSSSVVTPVSGSKVQDMQSNLSPLSPDPPPPVDKSPNRAFIRPNPTANLLDDDEFSDFQSHETQTTHAQPSLFDTAFDSSSNKTTTLGNVAAQDDPFDNFSSFISQHSALQSPPVQSPTSPTSPPGIPPPLPRKQPPANLNTLHVRRPSAADHDAAARLVERAAARPGRWPAPPSPLPNPLPPPPSSSANSRTSKASDQSFLALDDHGSAQAPTASGGSITLKPIGEITSSVVPLSKPASSRAPLMPPPGSTSKIKLTPQASLLDFGDFAQPVQTHALDKQKVAATPNPPSASTKGGLSAQDLSFFEGL